MGKDDTLRLDTHALLRKLETLELKQGWVADRIGVSRKTVNRWCTGRVKRLARDSAEALCQVLDCGLDELTVGEDRDVLATKAEQAAAARLIQENDLLQLLSPSDNWALAESLIKASMQPDLALRDLGRLYNLLSIAAWRQGHYEDGRRHAGSAREIGERTGDESVTCNALANLAVIDSFLGDLGAALAKYEHCLLRPGAFDTPRERAKVLSNLGDAYRSFLRFDESLAAQEESIRLFAEEGLDLNLAISWVSKGVLCCEWGRFAEASAAHREGELAAVRAGYKRGIDCAPFYVADPLSLSGDCEAARRLVDAALPRLARHAVHDLGCLQIAARVYRRAGALGLAEAQVAEGLRRSADFPELSGMMLLERARLALARGDAAGEAAARAAANEAFARAGLGLRIRHEPVREHGAGHDA